MKYFVTKLKFHYKSIKIVKMRIQNYFVSIFWIKWYKKINKSKRLNEKETFGYFYEMLLKVLSAYNADIHGTN